MMTLEKFIETIVERSKTKPSSTWGERVLEIDNRVMGKMARDYRIKKGVLASHVGAKMQISKARIHFLEKGRTAWTPSILAQYLKVVQRLAKEESNAVRKVQSKTAPPQKKVSSRKAT